MFQKLFVAHLKMLVRNRGALVAALIFPIFFAGLLGAATRISEGETKLAVVNQGGESGTQFLRAMRAAKFEITEIRSVAEIENAFEKQRLSGALVIPSLSRKAVVTFVFDEKNTQQFGRTRERVQSFVDKYNLSLAGGSEVISLQERGLRTPDDQKERTLFELVLPSVLMFSVIFATLSFGSTQAVKYRERGVFKRLMVTPLSARSFLVSEMLTRLLLAIVQTTLVFVVGVVIERRVPSPHIFWLYLLALMGVMVFINLGFIAAGLASNPEAVAGVTQLVGVILVVMSGGILQSLFPPQIEKAVEFLPVLPMVNSMLGVVISQKNPFSAAPLETLVLASWAIATFLFAVVVFRFRAPSKR